MAHDDLGAPPQAHAAERARFHAMTEGTQADWPALVEVTLAG